MLSEKVRIFDKKVTEIKVSKIRVSKIRVSKIRVSKIRVTEIRVTKIRVTKIRVSEIRISSNHRSMELFFVEKQLSEIYLCNEIRTDELFSESRLTVAHRYRKRSVKLETSQCFPVHTGFSSGRCTKCKAEASKMDQVAPNIAKNAFMCCQYINVVGEVVAREMHWVYLCFNYSIYAKFRVRVRRVPCIFLRCFYFCLCVAVDFTPCSKSWCSCW